MKKDIFDLKLGESKKFDRAQVFFSLSGSSSPTIHKTKTYGVWYTKKHGVKCFYLKHKKDNSRMWYWSIKANLVFATLEDAKIGVKHHLIKKYEDLLEQQQKDIVRISGLLKDSNNFNVVGLEKSYMKNTWNIIPKFRKEQSTTS